MINFNVTINDSVLWSAVGCGSLAVTTLAALKCRELVKDGDVSKESYIKAAACGMLTSSSAIVTCYSFAKLKTTK